MSADFHGPGDAAVSPDICLLNRDAETGVATVTLNRPARLNALNHQLLLELAGAVESLASDDAVRCVVITGAGGAFCAGADTSELAGGDSRGPHQLGPGGAEALRRGFRDAQRLVLGLHRMEKPTIAAISGVAAGAGLDLACACDIRIASTDARFSSAYVRVGLFPGYGGTWFYPRLVGMSRAAEMTFTGELMDAAEALRCGLVSRVVASDRLATAARTLAEKIAAGPPIAIRLAKSLLYRGLEMDLDTSMQVAAAAESITLSSNDHAEGMAALREKRPPRFTGS